MNSCIICKYIFENSICDSYNKCISCGSYIYISDSSAADLNKEFYNNLQISKYNVDIFKKIFSIFIKAWISGKGLLLIRSSMPSTPLYWKSSETDTKLFWRSGLEPGRI